MAKKIEPPDLNSVDSDRKYGLGAMYLLPDGAAFRYGEINFGSIGKINGKEQKLIQYRWVPWNRIAALHGVR